jgi:hypothetical protein
VWFGAFGALAAYALHLLVAPPLVALACDRGQFLPLALLVILPLGAAIASVVAAHRLWRGTEDLRSDAGTVPATARFLTGLGIIISPFFVFLIVFGSFPILFVDPCL